MAPPMAYITFTADPQTYADIEELRKAEGRSLSTMVRILVKLGIRQRWAEAAPPFTK